MSTNHGNYGGFLLTTFYGGEKRGTCLQLTLPYTGRSLTGGGSYQQLTRDGVEQLHEALGKWLKGELPDEDDEKEPR